MTRGRRPTSFDHGSAAERTARFTVESGFSLIETLVVVGLIAVLSAIAVPMTGHALANFRLTGDVRSVSNATALTKMRAAANFSRVRLHVDFGARSHRLEALDKTVTPNHWTPVGGATSLSTKVSFSSGIVSAPPTGTQAAILQAPACTDDAGTSIANTACVTFNSRGVPVDNSGAPTAADALYLTDGTAVYAVTVSATGMLRVWHTPPAATPTWVLE